jgi:hypothetical protein
MVVQSSETVLGFLDSRGCGRTVQVSWSVRVTVLFAVENRLGEFTILWEATSLVSNISTSCCCAMILYSFSAGLSMRLFVFIMLSAMESQFNPVTRWLVHHDGMMERTSSTSSESLQGRNSDCQVVKTDVLAERVGSFIGLSESDFTHAN